MKRLALVLATVAAAAAAFAVSLQAAPATRTEDPPSGHVGGIVPTHQEALRRSRGAAPLPSWDSGHLDYAGGPVMHGANLYTIFWSPASRPIGASYVSLVNQFLTDASKASSTNKNVFGPQSPLTDTTGDGAYYELALAGTVTDTAAFPASGCAQSGGDPCLTDAQLQAKIDAVRIAQGWPTGLNAIYLLYTAPNVDTCMPGPYCSADYAPSPWFCAYHGHFLSGGQQVIYANEPGFTLGNPGCDLVPYPYGPSDVAQHPNNNDAEIALSTSAHEISEAMTDPLVGHSVGDSEGWVDDLSPDGGHENADKCAYVFGKGKGTAGAQYNQTINGNHYWIQLNWDNKGNKCIAKGGSVLKPDPTISSYAPTTQSVGGHITITGTNFPSTKSVKIGGKKAVFTVQSLTRLDAVVPVGAKSGGKVTVQNQGGKVDAATPITIS